MPEPKPHLSRLAAHAQSIFEGRALQQFGALCVRQSRSGVEVLLVTTRETGRWTIPKGWPIKDLPAHKVAEREAWEEAGVKGRAKKRVLGHYTYLKVLDDGQKVPAFVEVHRLDVECAKKDFPECKQRKVTWLPPLEATLLVNEPELKKLLERLNEPPKATPTVFRETP